MAKSTDILDITQSVMQDGRRYGVLQQTPEDWPLDGRSLCLNGRTVVNFGSCSYLGLEFHPALQQGVIDAVQRYGTQFSSSRSYLSAPAYPALEAQLSELFGGPTLMTTTTTQGHQAIMPTVIGPEDAVILDQQVHHSVQMATHLLRPQGTHVELVRHNRLDLLEERAQALSASHRQVWYMADGVYSMYADLAPVEALEALRDRYPQLHLYFDDSHGMSWRGLHGRGYVLDTLASRERTIVACSLNKAFAAAGGALVFPDAAMLQKVRDCGGPLVFSGPVQPPMLGAALASVRLHLDGTVARLQEALAERIRLFNRLAGERGLPLVALSEAPIRTIGVGQPGAAMQLAERLLEAGFYVNVATFPAVPMKQAGIRVTLTLHQTQEDLEGLVEALAVHLPAVLAETGTSLEAVRRLFGLPEALPFAGASLPEAMATVTRAVAASLSLTRESSIHALDAPEWDRWMADRGNFDARGLAALEQAFGPSAGQDAWRFHYFVVRDAAGEVVLATFATEARWKEDMLASAEVSARIEQMRAQAPDYLVSRVLMVGSLLTEGEHLYLDRDKDWQGALRLLVQALAEIQAASAPEARPNALLLRDFRTDDVALDQWMLGAGFNKFSMLDTHTTHLAAGDVASFLAGLSHKRRQELKKKVLAFGERYAIEVIRPGETRSLTPVEAARGHDLYRNVHGRNLALNTFPLPADILTHVSRAPGYEVVLLRRQDTPEVLPVGVVVGYLNGKTYQSLFVGLDYTYVEAEGLYRQCLWQQVRRALALGCERIEWGFSAEVEKRRFGAQAQARCVYVQMEDLFGAEVIADWEARVSQV